MWFVWPYESCANADTPKTDNGPPAPTGTLAGPSFLTKHLQDCLSFKFHKLTAPAPRIKRMTRHRVEDLNITLRFKTMK